MKTKTLSAIASGIRDAVPALKSKIGGLWNTASDAVAGVVYEVYQEAKGQFKQAYMRTAEGLFLDWLIEPFGKLRHDPVYAQGEALFARPAAKSTAQRIPPGTVWASLPDSLGRVYRFETIDEAFIAAGETSVSVLSIAESAGASYNLAAGTSIELKTHVSGVSSVTLPDGWLTVSGRDSERTAEYRKRGFLAFDELRTQPNDAALISIALDHEQVTDAWVDSAQPRGEGTVDIYILTAAGLPSAELIAEVQALYDGLKVLCYDILVKAPEAKSVDVTLLVTWLINYDSARIQSDIERRIGVFFGAAEADEEADADILPLKSGNDVIKAQLVKIAMAVDGVYNVTVSAPSSDLSIAPRELPQLGTLIVSMTEPTRELGGNA